jgi:hypothetical protein
MRTLVKETLFKDHTIRIWGDEHLYYDYEIINPNGESILDKDDNYTSVEDAISDAKDYFRTLHPEYFED